MNESTNLKTEQEIIHVKRIIENVKFWRFDYYLIPRVHIQPFFSKNDDVNVRWVFKNANRIEFIIKNFSPELKKYIKEELSKDGCSGKFIKKKKNKNEDFQYMLIVKEKNLCVIS